MASSLHDSPAQAVRTTPQSRTEEQNPLTLGLDSMSVEDMLTVMNREDQQVPLAVAARIPQIAQAAQKAAASFAAGGRLIYVGAGTSGRLGVLDAAECPPTFGTDPGQVVGLLAGGTRAMFEAVENAEDSAEQGAADLDDIALSPNDLVVGIAASGRTPYVIGALDRARAAGAATVGISCNVDSAVGAHADIAIELDCGPEVLTGSTRLKAGTAQKLVLNMISTAAMVQSGKVYGNLMVDVRPTNQKLVDRAARIVQAATDCDRETAESALRAADYHAKTAIVAILCGIDADTARARLDSSGGFVRAAIA